MPATPARIGFITQEFRTATVEDTTYVPGRYGSLARKTTDVVETFFDDITDTQAICTERFNLLSADRRRFQIDLQSTDALEGVPMNLTTPSATVVDPERQANMPAAIVSVVKDFETDKTTVMAWG